MKDKQKDDPTKANFGWELFKDAISKPGTPPVLRKGDLISGRRIPFFVDPSTGLHRDKEMSGVKDIFVCSENNDIHTSLLSRTVDELSLIDRKKVVNLISLLMDCDDDINGQERQNLSNELKKLESTKDDFINGVIKVKINGLKVKVVVLGASDSIQPGDFQTRLFSNTTYGTSDLNKRNHFRRLLYVDLIRRGKMEGLHTVSTGSIGCRVDEFATNRVFLRKIIK